MTEAVDKPSNFIREIIDAELAAGKHAEIVTRFPPEPNGYLHIGHAKSICLNFGLARDYRGRCHLRFDDTNPVKEDTEYTDSIERDVRWLGFDWGRHLYYASDYYEKIYAFAVQLIERERAYVCELNEEEMRAHRGTLKEPGTPSPGRTRSVAENLDLFARMRAGEFPDGKLTLRAKIDMGSPNINMRDPVIYRIRRAHHHRTGDAWCIYPMYDFAHALSDMLEGITHSVCTLEFEDHRPLYNWFLEVLGTEHRPRQIEFARLNLTYTVMSKRKLLELVTQQLVSGWDDPRLPTLSGLRRRGYPPAAIREFCDRIGVAKANSLVDLSLLEFCVRENLNKSARRMLAVLRPLKMVIENYPEGQVEEFAAENNPEDPNAGTRPVRFAREVYVEADDYSENPAKGWFRLAPGKEVRLKYAYYVTVRAAVKDAAGAVVELRCTYDPDSRGGGTADGRKVRGTLHWVAVQDAVPAEVRLYDNLFTVADLDGAPGDYKDHLNPKSLETVMAMVEPALAGAAAGEQFQFLRQGYFVCDQESVPGKPVFNRTVTLKDTWAKQAKK
ncbi:MAG TPA: glutamine--tRNA ligase/YqeY domain fusion protein [bacterium]|nr:glutamine--tRNA ligase/YqeY domain fusion protein [bacterium]